MNTVALLAAALLELSAQDPAADAERTLYEQTRLLPDCADSSLAETSRNELRTEAARLEIGELAIGSAGDAEVVKVGDAGSPVQLRRVDVSGSGGLFEVQMLLHRVAFERTFRATDLETLRITAADGGKVRFSARIADACWDTKWTPPRARTEAEHLEVIRPVSSMIARLLERMQPLRLTAGLEAIEEDWGDVSLLLTEARFVDSQLTLQGVTLGAKARASIEPVLRNAGFAAPRIEWAANGDCRAFTAVTQLATEPAPEREAVPKDVFDERTSALCNPGPATQPVVVKARGSGAITLRARGIDVTSVFFLLNDLSPADGFVVEPDVQGRVDLDLEHVTVAEALEALRAAGVASATAGPLHRICRSACKPAKRPAQNYEGTPVSFLLADADVVDVFRLFREITGLEIHARELKGSLAIYAREVEWDRLFDGVIAAIGKSYAIGEKGVMIDPDGVPVEKLPSAPWRRSLKQTDLAQIAVEDLRVAASGGGKVWVRVPGSSKQLLELTPGTALYDGRVEAVREGEIVLADGRRLKM